MTTKDEIVSEFTKLLGLAIITREEREVLFYLAKAISYANDEEMELAMEAYHTAQAIVERREMEVLQ